MTEIPRGIYPPVATPFQGEDFDEEAFRFNLARWGQTPLAGYVVAGSNGEGPFLTDDEVERCVGIAKEVAGPRKFVMAGTGRESTRATQERTRCAARAGAQAALVLSPSYFRGSMTEASLNAHFQRVADSAEIPIVLYHVPKFCPITMRAELILKLAEHENILGIKETSGDMVLQARLIKESPTRFRVLVGTASHLLVGMALGADGAIAALANIAPKLCCSLPELVQRGRLHEARDLQFRMLPVNQAITALYGVPGLKFAMDELGYRGGDSLAPLSPLDPDARADIRSRLEAAGWADKEVIF